MIATPKPNQGQEPEPKPGIEVDDHLYVHHQGQPCTGRVVCHGRHGVTVDVGGKHAKVTWDKVLGHKRRVALQGDVVDQGEDGMIVQDKSGRRRFIAVPNESTEDPMVAKSLQRPTLLFMKAGIAPGPGLSQKRITDKNGVQTTRWVSTVAKSPPAQRGQHVGFANGEHRGHGEVIASGKHGVTVRDSAGGDHRVHHEKVTHHWQGEGKPVSSPHPEPAAKPSNDPKYLFDEAELAKLPAKVNQPHANWDDLIKHGTEGLAQFRESLGKVAQTMGLQSGRKPDELTPEDWANDQGYLFLAPLKGAARAKEKVESDYGGDWSQLRDIVRATISVPSMHGVSEALAHLKSNGIELAQRPKNRFSQPTDLGYRDLMAIVKLPNGMLAELQIHVKAMTLAKEQGHEHYNTSRGLQAKYGEEAPSEKWSPDDRKKFEEAVAAQRELYDTVWTKANGGEAANDQKPPQQPAMQKAQDSSKMIMLIKGIG